MSSVEEFLVKTFTQLFVIKIKNVMLNNLCQASNNLKEKKRGSEK